MLYRQDYLGVSVKVTTTATTVQSLIEDILGLSAGALAAIYREIQIQVDPEVSSGASVRIGVGSLGTTVTTALQGAVVQKGITLVGSAAGPYDTVRAGMNNVYLGKVFAQAVTGTAILNIQLWSV